MFVFKALVFSANAGTISRPVAADNHIFDRKLVVIITHHADVVGQTFIL